MSHRLGCS